MASKLQIRRDTAANWTSVNPTLAAGELGFENNTGKFKIGDGTTAWTSLGYATNVALILPAGTATVPPLNLASGTLTTTAQAGAVEYDGTAFYASIAASTRGALPAEQLVVLSSTNTLTSQTAAQPLFDGGGGPTNGAVTLPVGSYQFECLYSLTAMSTSSGSFGFALGGTATFTQSWVSLAVKAAQATATSPQMTFGTAANTTLATATTSATGEAWIKGIIRVTVAGTVIPQVSLTVAATAVVGTNSYFKISSVGNATVASLGNWS